MSSDTRSSLTNRDPMPYGKYQGLPMSEVPASYLLFLNDSSKTSVEVQNYINENWESLNDYDEFI